MLVLRCSMGMNFTSLAPTTNSALLGSSWKIDRLPLLNTSIVLLLAAEQQARVMFPITSSSLMATTCLCKRRQRWCVQGYSVSTVKLEAVCSAYTMGARLTVGQQ